MIVYSGKQFGNDFNNGDEGLFQDANRPRDNDKFKIRPGLQSDKWNQRDVNKNIKADMAQLAAEGNTYDVPSASSMPSESTISVLSESVKKGNPGCIVNKNGYIEIVEDGAYIIQAFTQFFPSTTPSSSYQYMEKVGLLVHKTGNYTGYERSLRAVNQGRMCGSGDEIMARWAGVFKQGSIITVGALHTYNSTMRLKQRVNVLRIV